MMKSYIVSIEGHKLLYREETDRLGRVIAKSWYSEKYKELFHPSGPAAINYDENGYVSLESFFQFIGNDCYSIEKEYYNGGGTVFRESFYKNYTKHRLDGPAEIFYHNTNNRRSEFWYINGRHIDVPFDHWPLTDAEQVELKLLYC